MKLFLKIEQYLFIRFECWFGRLRLRHFISQQFQHFLSGIPLGHLLTRPQPLCSLAAHSHLQQKMEVTKNPTKNKQAKKGKRKHDCQHASNCRWFTCMTNSLRRGRPRSVTMLYSGSFSFLACWIWAKRLMGFIPWPYSGLVCSCWHDGQIITLWTAFRSLLTNPNQR